MRFRRTVGILFAVLICLALAACDQWGEAMAGGGTPASASPAAPTSSAPTPRPTPAPSPTPAPTPTPTPEPTPTPDPWADKFHTGGGAYISYKDFNNGPWIYKDAGLSVEIHRLEGSRRNIYYKAEIYARGALFTRGMSFKVQAKPGKGKTEYPYKIARRYDAVFGIMADYYTIKRRGVVLIRGKTYRDEKKTPRLPYCPTAA